MPLSHRDQMTLIKDILSNHQTDACGSVAECEQLKRLVKSLLVNPSINNNIRPILEQVYSYSQDGMNTQHLDDHILSNQNNLSKWVEDMNSYS
ncbi:YtzH-like family protein [Bacillus sp. FJAT-49736]|uniref:YtzH-like family protein n=1 Tax=Bacillus sp. FJAT-49736 TaxID=2833582 RepID=UPI001BC95DE8|nr:YtzH-like family protein [Bacillus sp. FJAT-49736]MBS4173863.1 YtzH-like family protein [Bacillus sp. FJAT-49736]